MIRSKVQFDSEENLLWYITTKTPKNAELLILPTVALNNILPGSCMKAFRLNKTAGIKCNAP